MWHSLIPSPIFQVALLACLLLPVLLLTISLIAPKQLPAKLRLIFAVASSPFFSVAIGWLFIPQFLHNPLFNWTDVSCALLLYGTAVMVVYSAWSLIGYGFTVSILLDAARAKVPLTQDDLMQSFAGGNGLQAFMNDRASLLLRMRLMKVNGHVYTLTGFKSLIFALVVKLSMDIYAIRQRELN